ncbi:glycine--tRNA ligase subunit beta [Candidatus Symbiobacter mobilis]|uniref:Glycine--tRNA ligase beta subunit n=1 Tax=Candidatus Symbiobacter mobilis CR TaxID=946483 RepID=U5N5J2_9BURK|nr:glycine--tRNA ligase subunit beta [Candidatus Symbiobacter mobilis]AGX86530.1 glycyl-tRNA synthetase subunit beta [Candidatus Symbiobacter mobilis CR]
MNLLVELLVEELPPKALAKLGAALAQVLWEQLQQLGLAGAESVITPFATPRRLAVHVTQVLPQAPDKPVRHRLMPVSVGLDAAGQPTQALRKKLLALGVADVEAVVPTLLQVPDGKAVALWFEQTAVGATLQAGLQQALETALDRLPIPKVMSYPLESDCALPGWNVVRFVRPAHGLVALYGDAVVDVTVLGLHAGRTTQGHRFLASGPLSIPSADEYELVLYRDGKVVCGFAQRKQEILRQLHEAAEGEGARVLEDEALLDEVTALVEWPRVLVCIFEADFLEVPQECLILTMQANQKYFPLLDAAGKLLPRFLVVSNIDPADPAAVRGGNERVVRSRLSDARFFYDQDRKKTLESRVAGLDKVVYHHRLGSLGDRVRRVESIAERIAGRLIAVGKRIPARCDTTQVDTLVDNFVDISVDTLVDRVRCAARLAKADLLTDMVGEFAELQGVMGAYYARHDGLPEDVAEAIEDHYKPRFAADTLPRNPVGTVLALADKLETLVGMFGIGNLPTGEKDPFALRRHALGVVRMLIDKGLPLDLDTLLTDAHAAFGAVRAASPAGGWDAGVCAALQTFFLDRLAGYLRERGYTTREVDAVLALRPQRLCELPRRLAAVRAFAALPEAAALAAANKRIANLLGKSDTTVAASGSLQESLFTEAAERALYQAMQSTLAIAQAKRAEGDDTASLQALAALRSPVDAFFNEVMVLCEEQVVRSNRLRLLHTLHQAMNQVADLARLA